MYYWAKIEKSLNFLYKQTVLALLITIILIDETNANDDDTYICNDK